MTFSHDQTLVSKTMVGSIAVLTISNPPVNALGLALRTALRDHLQLVLGEDEVRGVVLTCAGKTFVAGADISELGTPRQTTSPILPELCSLIASAPKPVVAAMHGHALGGGLELALSCHFRVAARGTKLGFPEVKLGIIPGAGGTVRLPRLTGPVRALELIASGASIGTDEAMAFGLVDTVAEGDLTSAACDYLGALLKTGDLAGALSSRQGDEKLEDARRDSTDLDALAARIEKKARGLTAPLACVMAVRNAVAFTFDEALSKERELFLILSKSMESKALRHLFFAERKSTTLSSSGADVRARSVKFVGVIGAGTMGTGIAMALLAADLRVVLVEQDAAALERGHERIRRSFDSAVSRGSLSIAQAGRQNASITCTTDMSSIAQCDFIIEAVYESMDVKKAVFKQIDAVCRPDAILATNTSYLDVKAIAAVTSRPSDVVGMHFFSPANLMRLVEVVRSSEMSEDVIATTVKLARTIGKVPVVVGICHGFVGNRMLAVRTAAVERLLLEGVAPEEIDSSFTKFGWAMGPCRVADLAGLDIGWRNRSAYGGFAPVADALCAAGQFGQKTGKGFYLYSETLSDPKPNPDIAGIAAAQAAALGIPPRSACPDEIIERTHMPMVQEAQRILDEGIAACSSDIDLIWVNGYGFPASKGGPMFWAENARLPEQA